MLNSTAQFVDRAKALAPAIRQRAAETETQRKPADASIQDIVDAGLVSLLVPQKWGGPESDLPTMFSVVEEISKACVSTGWVTSFYICHNVYPTRLSPKLQEEVFGQRGYTLLPASNAPTVKAKRVVGGWQVSGRASWGSGVMHADWVFVSAMAEEGPIAMMLPIADIRIDDVWHFAGMAGTGSNDIVIEDKFVPEYRSVSAVDFRSGKTEGTALYDNPLYSMPHLPLAYCTVIGVISGGLLGALTEYRQIVERRVRNFSGTVVKEQPQAHVTLGEYEITAAIVHDLARQLVDETQAIVNNRPFTLTDRVALKGKMAFVSKLARDTVNAIMASAGSSNFHLDQPIQRIWRDLNTVCTHAFWDWDVTREQVGRVQLDLQPNHPLV